MADPQITKCTRDNDHLLLCVGLRRIVNDGGSIDTLDRLVEVTNETATFGAAYYPNLQPRKDRPAPLAFNYCPFCGADIRITAAS